MNALLAIIPKVLMSIGMRLLSEKLIEEVVLWGLKKLAESTKTNVDNELYAMVEKALNTKKS